MKARPVDKKRALKFDRAKLKVQHLARLAVFEKEIEDAYGIDTEAGGGQCHDRGELARKNGIIETAERRMRDEKRDYARHREWLDEEEASIGGELCRHRDHGRRIIAGAEERLRVKAAGPPAAAAAPPATATDGGRPTRRPKRARQT